MIKWILLYFDTKHNNSYIKSVDCLPVSLCSSHVSKVPNMTSSFFTASLNGSMFCRAQLSLKVVWNEFTVRIRHLTCDLMTFVIFRSLRSVFKLLRPFVGKDTLLRLYNRHTKPETSLLLQIYVWHVIFNTVDSLFE